jgi:hypothetical protein
MTTRANFLATMAERRAWPRDTAEHAYLTRTARKLVWLLRDVPTMEWRTR